MTTIISLGFKVLGLQCGAASGRRAQRRHARRPEAVPRARQFYRAAPDLAVPVGNLDGVGKQLGSGVGPAEPAAEVGCPGAPVQLPVYARASDSGSACSAAGRRS